MTNLAQGCGGGMPGCGGNDMTMLLFMMMMCPQMFSGGGNDMMMLMLMMMMNPKY